MIRKKQPSKKKNKRYFWNWHILPFPNSYGEVTEFKGDDIITHHEFSIELGRFKHKTMIDFNGHCFDWLEWEPKCSVTTKSGEHCPGKPTKTINGSDVCNKCYDNYRNE